MCWNLKCHAWLKLKWAPHKWCQSNFSVYIFAVCPSFRVYLSSISTICNINFYCVCVIIRDSTIQCRVSELSTRERRLQCKTEEEQVYMEQRDSCRQGSECRGLRIQGPESKIQEQVTSVALPGRCIWVLLHPIYAPVHVHPSWPMHV